MLNGQGSLNEGVLGWPTHASIWKECECDSDQAISFVYKQGDHNKKYETHSEIWCGGGLPDLPTRSKQY